MIDILGWEAKMLPIPVLLLSIKVKVDRMDSDTNQAPFETLVLAIGNLDDNELAQAHSFVQTLLNQIPPEQLHAAKFIINMNYVEMLKTQKFNIQEIELDSLLKSISRLDVEMLRLLDSMIIFVNHKLELKAAMPEILQKARYEVKHRLIPI